jgi:hypothetical protein
MSAQGMWRLQAVQRLQLATLQHALLHTVQLLLQCGMPVHARIWQATDTPCEVALHPWQAKR